MFLPAGHGPLNSSDGRYRMRYLPHVVDAAVRPVGPAGVLYFRKRYIIRASLLWQLTFSAKMLGSDVIMSIRGMGARRSWTQWRCARRESTESREAGAGSRIHYLSDLFGVLRFHVLHVYIRHDIAWLITSYAVLDVSLEVSATSAPEKVV